MAQQHVIISFNAEQFEEILSAALNMSNQIREVASSIGYSVRELQEKGLPDCADEIQAIAESLKYVAKAIEGDVGP